MAIFLPIMMGISALGSAISGIHASNVAKRNTDRTIAENKRLAELSYQRELKNIQGMNEYNSPASQMSRFKQAGLNPNLVYTQGTPGNQSQIAKYNAPTVEYNYKPKITPEFFNRLGNIATEFYSVKKLISEGQIMEAKAITEKALSKYADSLALQRNNIALLDTDLKLFQSLFKQEEMNRFFYKTSQKTSDGRDVWKIRPEAEETFVQDLVARWMLTRQKSELMNKESIIKSQQMEIFVQQLSNMKVLPWLQPIIQLLGLYPKFYELGN